jgi:hypothetical protein
VEGNKKAKKRSSGILRKYYESCDWKKLDLCEFKFWITNSQNTKDHVQVFYFGLTVWMGSFLIEGSRQNPHRCCIRQTLEQHHSAIDCARSALVWQTADVLKSIFWVPTNVKLEIVISIINRLVYIHSNTLTIPKFYGGRGSTNLESDHAQQEK